MLLPVTKYESALLRMKRPARIRRISRREMRVAPSSSSAMRSLDFDVASTSCGEVAGPSEESLTVLKDALGRERRFWEVMVLWGSTEKSEGFVGRT